MDTYLEINTLTVILNIHGCFRVLEIEPGADFFHLKLSKHDRVKTTCFAYGGVFGSLSPIRFSWFPIRNVYYTNGFY